MFLFFQGNLYSFYTAEYIRMKNSPAFTGKSIFNYLNFNYTVHDQGSDKSDSWEIIPGLGYSFTSWVLLDLRCVMGKYGAGYLSGEDKSKYPTGPSFMIDSVVLDLVFGMADSSKVPVGLGLDLFYRIPTDRSMDLLNRNHYFGFTFILSETFGTGHNATVNYTYARDGDKDVFEWTAGSFFLVAQSGGAVLKIGSELIGDFSGHSGILPGLYTIILDSISIKTGVFIGFSQYTKEHKHDGNKEDDLAISFSLSKKW